MKILLTGATGLIGAEIYKKLSVNHQLLRLGRRSICEVQADFSKPETLENLSFKDCKTVIHCAGITDEDFKSSPAKAYIQSTLGINTLIQTAIKNNIERFFYISSSHVYGFQTGIIDENTSANPLSDYGIAHFASEQILRRNAENIKHCWVLRPNAVFGEPLQIDSFDRWNLIPFSFPLEAAYNKKIVLRSSGEQNRNFVGTEDLANLIERLLTYNTAKRFNLINPIGKKTISVYEFAQTTAEAYKKLTGNDCEIERPAAIEKIKSEEFIYRSNFNFNLEKADLETYLINILSRVLNDYKHGKKYTA